MFSCAISPSADWVLRQVPLDDESRKVLASACEGLPGRFQEGGFVVQGEGLPEVPGLPSGELTKSYWKWQFIVDFPIKNGDFP